MQLAAYGAFGAATRAAEELSNEGSASQRSASLYCALVVFRPYFDFKTRVNPDLSRTLALEFRDGT